MFFIHFFIKPEQSGGFVIHPIFFIMKGNDKFQGLDFLPEIAVIHAFIQDRLIQILHLPDRKFLGKQFKAKRFGADFMSYDLQSLEMIRL